MEDNSMNSPSMTDETRMDVDSAETSDSVSEAQRIQQEADAFVQRMSTEELLAKEEVPEYARRFVYPLTQDTNDFWHCSKVKWNDYIRASADKSKKKNALNQLRKISVAGRLMESEEGIEAVKGCDECGKHEGVKCVVPANDDAGNVCAFCTRNSRSNCNAKREEIEEELSVEDRLVIAEAKVMALERKVRDLQSELDSQKTHREALDQWNRWAFEKINQLCDATGVEKDH